MAKDTIKTCIANIAANDATREEWLDKLRPLVEAKGWDREQASQELKPLYAKARGVTLIVATRGTKAGQATFDQKDARSERARRAFDRLMEDLFDGTGASAKGDDGGFSVPEDVAKLAAKLAALCAQYRHPNTDAEITRKLANKALSAALSAIKAK